MAKPAFTYVSHADATAESELAALQNVYRLVLGKAMKGGCLPDEGGPDDGTKSKEDSANEHHSR